MTEEHPFARYIRILAKGPNLSRPLSEAEMTEAARMVLAGQVEPLQLGALLCILRIRTEVPAEGAGFVRAVRETYDRPADAPMVDIDWPSYAGKKRQLPWYLLAAMALAQNGIKICMQGTEGHTPDRVYSREALAVLGISAATSLDQAAAQITASNFAYLPLKALSPRLQEIIELKSIIGVRSPVNTFARHINPFAAPHQLLTVVHPNYRVIHREIARLLGQPHMAVFKGEGGEAEVRPTKALDVQMLHGNEAVDETWPALLPDDTAEKDAGMDLDRLLRVWRGDDEDAYGRAAVIGTVAIALRLLGRAAGPTEAIAAADAMWRQRKRDQLLVA